MSVLRFGAGVAAVLAAAGAQATVSVTLENPRAQNTSIALSDKQVATFESNHGWTSTGVDVFAGSPISGTIRDGGLLAWDANEYGGVAGTGRFAAVQGSASFALSQAVTYAGLWASAIDGDFSLSLGNTVSLYSGDTLLGSYALKSLITSWDYYGNPTEPFSGRNGGEPYAFFNFVSDQAFDRIDVTQNGGGGFEFDNLTIGNVVTGRPTPPPQSSSPAPGAVPESATWMMMILGFGATGAMLRRRSGTLVAA
jgi:hypothetical protein